MLLWCDGFEHYGTSPNGGRDNMLDGPWAEFGGLQDPAISTAQSRTGSHSLFFNGGSDLSSDPQLARRLLGADKAVVGIGFGLYMPAVPAANNRGGWTLRDNANAVVLTFALQSDASIEVFRGAVTGTSIGRSGQVLTAEAWNHVELRAHRDDTAGSVEIRVNGLTVLDIADENTGAADFAGVQWGRIASGGTVTTFSFYIDDVFAWDDQGAENTDFIGPLGVYTLFPDEDTAEADWAVTGAATGYDAINDPSPDDDTSYIAADTLADTSEFSLEDLPGGISNIAAVVAVGRMRKTDAGDGNVQMSLVSGASVTAGEDRPITEVYTYWQDVFELDPATGAPWTPAAVNAALLRLVRTL